MTQEMTFLSSGKHRIESDLDPHKHIALQPPALGLYRDLTGVLWHTWSKMCNGGDNFISEKISTPVKQLSCEQNGHVDNRGLLARPRDFRHATCERTSKDFIAESSVFFIFPARCGGRRRTHKTCFIFSRASILNS